MSNAGRLFDENRVDETKEPIVLLGPSLRLLAREGATEGHQLEAGDLATKAFERVNRLVRESMSGNLEGARTHFEFLKEELGRLGALFPPDMASSEIFSCVDHPEVAEHEAGQLCPECGKKLHPRRFPYSVIHTEVDHPTLSLDPGNHGPLRVGERNELGFRLTREDGEAVEPADLVLSHSRRVHLILLDETGTDFQHLAPEPGNEPGTYSVSWTPGSAASYRAWVFAIPAATRLTESLPWTLPGDKKSSPAVAPPEGSIFDGLVASEGNVTVRLVASGNGPLRIRSGRTHLVQAQVSDAEGNPLRELEPFWNAFAHLTMVAWDFSAAHQVHAVGGDILSADLRGGPDFAFKLHPPTPGWWRLYLQIRIEGKTLTFPLRLLVDP